MSGETSDTPATSPEQTPQERANDALAEAFSRIEDCQTHETIPQQASAENDVAREFASELAIAVCKGLNSAQASAYCGQIAEAAEFYNKTDLKGLLDEALEEEREANDGRQPLDQLIEEELEEVVIVKTSDARQSTLYRWHFKGGVMFETQSTKDGRTHFSWPEFRNEYFDAAHRDPAKPVQERRSGNDWRRFIVNIMDERAREVETRGPRTTAIDSLQNFIRRSTAYADIEHMVDFDGICIDDDPEDGDPSEIWIPNHDIKRICDTSELDSVRALQVELDARGFTVDRVTGVSEQTFVHGNSCTYWVLDADIATPGGYDADPKDPAEQVFAEQNEYDQSEDDDESGSGKIGTVGTAPDQSGDRDDSQTDWGEGDDDGPPDGQDGGEEEGQR